MKRCFLQAAVVLLFGAQMFAGNVTSYGTAKTNIPAPSKTSDAASPVVVKEDRLAEGEKRFRTNCGRCHQSPHKLSPRMMGTAVRHMRVRANITEDDMRLILEFITQ